MRKIFFPYLFLCVFGLTSIGTAHAYQTEGKKDNMPSEKVVKTDKKFLKKMIGKWEGRCQTWFKPGELVDDSAVSGEFVEVFGGRFVRHTYQGSMQSKPRFGEELIAFNSIFKQFEISWIDDFHMNYAILFSQGEPTPNGFKVAASYQMGPTQPKWGWRTEYELIDDNHLHITAFNILPTGEEYKGVETYYHRVVK